MNEKDFFERYIYDPEKDILGSGGFGSVYRAYDRVKNRYVAIKISQVKDIFGKFTLLNEVKLSQEIDDHTNVARYEFGLRVKHPFPVDYAIMAYYEEGNLDMVLRKKQGILTPQEQYEIVEGLLEGINHLHSENVIHRDLKLANILMHRTKQGHWRPKIADFGLSRQMDTYDASIANSAIGITIAYAAPEQIENKPIRKNVDLWAIGVVIYRVLTGDMPFAPVQGAEPTSATVEMSRKITQVELPLGLYNLQEPYQSIIKRCWVKDIKDRAQSASELLDILRHKKARSETTQQVPKTEISQIKPVFEKEIPNTQVLEIPLMSNDILLEQSTEISPSVSSPRASEKIEPLISDETVLDVNTDKILIDNSSIEPLIDDKTILDVDIDKTSIDNSSLETTSTVKSRSQKQDGNKTKVFIGAGLLCFLIGFMIWYNKTPQKTEAINTTTQTDTTVTPINKPVTTEANTTTITNTNTSAQVKKEHEKAISPPPVSVKKAASKPSGPIDQAGDFVLKLSCCCHQLEGGTITIHNFFIESNGKVSTTNNTSITIINHGKTITETAECQEKILSVFKNYYRWSSHGGSYYTMEQYRIDY